MTIDPFADIPSASDPWDDAKEPTFDQFPRLRQLWNRLLMIRVIRIEHGIQSRFKGADGMPITQSRATANIVVLDGGGLAWGGDPSGIPPTPHTQSSDVPVRFDGMYISGVRLIKQFEDPATGNPRRKPLLGRLIVLESRDNRKPPFELATPTEADKALARAYLAANPLSFD